MQTRSVLGTACEGTVSLSLHAHDARAQVVQLECLRRGIWGTSSTWRRVVTYKGDGDGDG